MRVAALVITCLLAAGCGSARRPASTTTERQPRRTEASGSPALRVAVLGRIAVNLAGVGPARVDDADLVVVAGRVPHLRALVASHPATHFVLVGRSYQRAPAKNVAGLLFREDEAAYLAGVVAGLVTADQGGLEASV